jgi:Domain of unknown function (DUF1877)
MGMCLCLVTLSDANIDRVLRDPPLIWRVVSPDDRELFESARAEQRRGPGLIGRLFGQKREIPSTSDLELTATEGHEADLDKAWHGIHYLLTGTAWEGEPPLDFLVRGGRTVGTIEVGYSPARVLTAEETVRSRRDDGPGSLPRDLGSLAGERRHARLSHGERADSSHFSGSIGRTGARSRDSAVLRFDGHDDSERPDR